MARIVYISAWARLMPTHDRVPLPNARIYCSRCSLSGFRSSMIHLSGLKVSGSGKSRGLLAMKREDMPIAVCLICYDIFNLRFQPKTPIYLRQRE